MIYKAKSNLLIPFAFDSSEWYKIDTCDGEQAQKTAEADSIAWFSYCFRALPVKESL